MFFFPYIMSFAKELNILTEWELLLLPLTDHCPYRLDVLLKADKYAFSFYKTIIGKGRIMNFFQYLSFELTSRFTLCQGDIIAAFLLIVSCNLIGVIVIG